MPTATERRLLPWLFLVPSRRRVGQASYFRTSIVVAFEEVKLEGVVVVDGMPEPVHRVVLGGQPAEQRLRELGLSVPLLHGAVEDGDEGRRQCTPYHPRQAEGQRMWSDTTAGLRRRCLSLNAGFAIDRTDNFETTVHKDKGLAIAVMGGDEFTGYRGGRDPRVRRKRGPVTHKRVTANHLGMEPLFSYGPRGDAAGELTSWRTWILLVRATDDLLYLELSQPIGFSDSGLVSDWIERILLPPLSISGEVTPIDDDGGDEVPLLVTKK